MRPHAAPLTLRRRRLWLLGAWLLGVVMLAPILTRPTLSFVLVVAVVAIWLAWKSVAYPLAAAGVPPLVDAIVGSNPLPKGGFTFLFAAWITLAVFFSIMRGKTGVPSRALMSVPVVLSFVLLGLMLLRLGPSSAEAYGSVKVQLFVADTLIVLVGAVFVGSSRADLEKFLMATLAILAGGALLLLFNLVSGGAHTVVADRFSLAAQEYPIYLARDSADGLLVAIYAILAATRPQVRAWAVAVSPALVVALIAAGSRGPIVAFAFGLVTLIGLAAASGRTRTRLLIVAGALLVAMILVPLVVPGSSIGRSLSAVLGSSAGLSSNGRSDLWSQAFTAFNLHPLLGVGWGGFAALNPSELYPHNILLEVSTELGIVGAAVVVGIVGGGARTLISIWRSTRGTEKLQAALLISLLLTAFVNALFSGAIQDNAHVWLWAGLGLGMSARLVGLPRRTPPLAHSEHAGAGGKVA